MLDHQTQHAMTSYEIQDGGRPTFCKSKIHTNLAAGRPIFTKFCKSTEISANLNF